MALVEASIGNQMRTGLAETRPLSVHPPDNFDLITSHALFVPSPSIAGLELPNIEVPILHRKKDGINRGKGAVFYLPSFGMRYGVEEVHHDLDALALYFDTIIMPPFLGLEPPYPDQEHFDDVRWDALGRHDGHLIRSAADYLGLDTYNIVGISAGTARAVHAGAHLTDRPMNIQMLGSPARNFTNRFTLLMRLVSEMKRGELSQIAGHVPELENPDRYRNIFSGEKLPMNVPNRMIPSFLQIWEWQRRLAESISSKITMSSDQINPNNELLVESFGIHLSRSRIRKALGRLPKDTRVTLVDYGQDNLSASSRLGKRVNRLNGRGRSIALVNVIGAAHDTSQNRDLVAGLIELAGSDWWESGIMRIRKSDLEKFVGTMLQTYESRPTPTPRGISGRVFDAASHLLESASWGRALGQERIRKSGIVYRSTSTINL